MVPSKGEEANLEKLRNTRKPIVPTESADNKTEASVTEAAVAAPIVPTESADNKTESSIIGTTAAPATATEANNA